MIRISHNIVIPDDELQEEFFQSSGPGGQNVNKVSTAVRLRFNVIESKSLTEELRARFLAKYTSRLSSSGELAIEAKRYRTQLKNREDAAERLINLFLEVLTPPKKRRPTRPTKASIARRIETKKKRGNIKANRTIKSFED